MTVVAFLDVLKATLTFWGLWACIFGVTAILVFRVQIGAFIDRLRKFGRGSWSAEADAPAQQEQKLPAAPIGEALAQAGTDKKSDPRTAADGILRAVARNQMIAEMEDKLRESLMQQGLTPNEPESYRVLLTLVASTAATAEFERLYNVIWTSQIEILHATNERVVSDEEARKHYDSASKVNPAFYRNYAYEQYMKFLLDQLLLLESPKRQYQITVKGRTFLLFMVNTGKPRQRPSVY